MLVFTLCFYLKYAVNQKKSINWTSKLYLFTYNRGYGNKILALLGVPFSIPLIWIFSFQHINLIQISLAIPNNFIFLVTLNGIIFLN